MRNPLARLPRHDPDRPSLRQRLASLRVTAARVLRRRPGEAAEAHPDAALLEAGTRYERAIAADYLAYAEWEVAWAPVRAVLNACPPELVVSWSDRMSILGGMCWPTAVGGNLFYLPPAEDGVMHEAWTPEILRSAIRLAVPRLGKAGQTPHHIRRWRGLLPAADKLSADYKAAADATDCEAKTKARDAAFRELYDAAWALRDFTASTPEGLAVLVRLADLDTSRGCRSDVNFLPSVAATVGVNLATMQRPREGVFR